MLMAYPDAYLYQCTHAGLVLTTAQETKHYRVMQDFFSSPLKRRV